MTSMMGHLSLSHFLVVGGLLFCFGLMTVLTRRNAVAMLMGIELILNGANVNLVAFNHFLHPHQVWGQGIVIFVVTLAAAEAVVGLSLVLAIYRNIQSVYAEKLNILHG